jgi:hypothetical protein
LDQSVFAGFHPSPIPPRFVFRELTAGSKNYAPLATEWRLFDTHLAIHSQQGNESESIFLAPYALISRILYHTVGPRPHRSGGLTLTVGQWDHVIGGPIPEVLALFDQLSVLLANQGSAPAANPTFTGAPRAAAQVEPPKPEPAPETKPASKAKSAAATEPAGEPAPQAAPMAPEPDTASTLVPAALVERVAPPAPLVTPTPVAPPPPAAQAGTRFCGHCGKQLSGGEKFCGSCGAQLAG